MMLADAQAAVRSGKQYRISYDDEVRIIEPHAVGLSRAGNAVMRAYQVRGGSTSGSEIGWKLLRLDQITGVAELPEASLAPRDGFKRGDKGMARVLAEV